MAGPPSDGRRRTAAEDELDALRAEALAAAERYARAAWETESPFVAGVTNVPVSGKVIGAPELRSLVDAALDGWLTEGRFAHAFRARLAEVIDRPHVALVGSGSQANLLAVAAATSHLHDRPLAPGDEVVTPAVGFPTTVAPLYQHSLRPVYVDSEADTYNPSLEAIAEAIGPRTRAVFMAHCLGNPFDAPGVAELCAEHDLVLLEDCCDALGSRIEGQLVGTFGQAATYSFYPAHHMTTGEGGAIATADRAWAGIVSSLREWGRDCWCPPGVDNVCGRRFEGRFGELPEGYDHKYVFSQVGYNLKVTDLQAALGLAQTDRLAAFAERRRSNFGRLRAALEPLEDRLILPRELPGAEPSWFGFPLTLRDGGAAQRRSLQLHLLARQVDSRLLLAGNMTLQPGFSGLEHRIHGSLPNADHITESALWVGCHQQLTPPMVDWIAESVTDFVQTT
ncbi:MAG: lipopolysaccharide biosynthesis protein RfbH [Solirubrobacterales bacterium]|nr:lipopolysaccharide biosynthesis protein RfbH [Solirubrobacterales bacterium]